MTPTEIVRAALSACEPCFMAGVCGTMPCKCAADVIAALGAAGYAVVERPRASAISAALDSDDPRTEEQASAELKAALDDLHKATRGNDG